MNSGIREPEKNYIKIFFCVPRCFVKTVKVCLNSKIESLMMNNENQKEYHYIFNGNILNPNSTFGEIGISNGKIMVAFKNKCEYDQWIKLSNDQSFEFKLHYLANKRTKKEFYRIRDIRDMKIEGNLKLYRRMQQKLYMKKMQKADDPIDFDYEINYEPSPVPCTNAMPILW